MIKTAMLAGAAHGNVYRVVYKMLNIWRIGLFALQTWKFRWDLHGGPSLCNGVRVLDPKISRVRIYMYYIPKLFRQEESGAMHVHLTPHFYVLFFFYYLMIIIFFLAMGISPWQRYRSIHDIGVVYIYSTISFYWITFIPGDDTNYKVNTNEETQHNVPVLTSPKRAPRETKNLSTLFDMLDIKNIPKMEMHSRTSMYNSLHTHMKIVTTLWLRGDGSFLLLPYILFIPIYGCDPYTSPSFPLRMIKKERKKKKSQVIGNELIFCVCIIYPCGTGMTFDSWVQAFFSQGCHFYFIFF